MLIVRAGTQDQRKISLVTEERRRTSIRGEGEERREGGKERATNSVRISSEICPFRLTLQCRTRVVNVTYYNTKNNINRGGEEREE